VIDNASGKIIADDFGYRPPGASTAEDASRRVEERAARLAAGMIRGTSRLTGASSAGLILERGPVHAAAKLGAKAEKVAGVTVAKIVNRIVRGWNTNQDVVSTDSPDVVLVGSSQRRP